MSKYRTKFLNEEDVPQARTRQRSESTAAEFFHVPVTGSAALATGQAMQRVRTRAYAFGNAVDHFFYYRTIPPSVLSSDASAAFVLTTSVENRKTPTSELREKLRTMTLESDDAWEWRIQEEQCLKRREKQAHDSKKPRDKEGPDVKKMRRRSSRSRSNSFGIAEGPVLVNETTTHVTFRSEDVATPSSPSAKKKSKKPVKNNRPIVEVSIKERVFMPQEEQRRRAYSVGSRTEAEMTPPRLDELPDLDQMLGEESGPSSEEELRQLGAPPPQLAQFTLWRKNMGESFNPETQRALAFFQRQAVDARRLQRTTSNADYFPMPQAGTAPPARSDRDKPLPRSMSYEGIRPEAERKVKMSAAEQRKVELQKLKSQAQALGQHWPQIEQYLSKAAAAGQTNYSRLPQRSAGNSGSTPTTPVKRQPEPLPPVETRMRQLSINDLEKELDYIREYATIIHAKVSELESERAKNTAPDPIHMLSGGLAERTYREGKRGNRRSLSPPRSNAFKKVAVSSAPISPKTSSASTSPTDFTPEGSPLVPSSGATTTSAASSAAAILRVEATRRTEVTSVIPQPVSVPAPLPERPMSAFSDSILPSNNAKKLYPLRPKGVTIPRITSPPSNTFALHISPRSAFSPAARQSPTGYHSGSSVSSSPPPPTTPPPASSAVPAIGATPTYMLQKEGISGYFTS